MAQAVVINYSGGEPGFHAATAGEPNHPIDFEEIEGFVLGEVVNNQDNPPVRFATSPDEIYVDTTAYGQAPHSGSFCAAVARDSWDSGSFEMLFDQLVRGASLWALDVHSDLLTTAYDAADEILWQGSIPCPGSETHVALLSSARDIARIRLESDWNGDGTGFDDVTIVIPEPATLSLLCLGGLAVIRKRKRNP